MTKRDISIKKRGRHTRIVKPVYLIIAEGKNKTEMLYLSHFREQNNRDNFIETGHFEPAPLSKEIQEAVRNSVYKALMPWRLKTALPTQRS